MINNSTAVTISHYDVSSTQSHRAGNESELRQHLPRKIRQGDLVESLEVEALPAVRDGVLVEIFQSR